MSNRLEVLKSRFENLNKKVEDATIVAVTKYSQLEDLKYTYQLGEHDFGESRINDLLEKDKQLPEPEYPLLNWHFIGNLQSNKIKKLLPLKRLKAIHSIDSLELLKKILDKAELVTANEVDLFLQVNTSGEEQKQGFSSYEETLVAYEYFKGITQDKFNLVGLMTMGGLRVEDQAVSARECFICLKEMAERIDSSLKLSMGMSSDFEIALEVGSDFVRVGSLIYKD